MLTNKIKNKTIIYKTIHEDLVKRCSKILSRKEKSFFFTPHISEYSLLSQNEWTKNLLNKEKSRREKKLSNLTNYTQIGLEKIKSKRNNKSNISKVCTNNKNTINNGKSNNKISNYNTYSKNLNTRRNKKIKNFYSISISKNLFSLNNDVNNNNNGKKIKLNNKDINPFSEKSKKLYNNTFRKPYKNDIIKKIPKKSISKFNLEKHNKTNFESHNITYNEHNNKNNYNKLNKETDLSKIVKINEQLESLYKKEKNNNCISNQIKINVNMNNSSKFTNISSHVSNLNSKKKPIEFINNINKLKKVFILKLKTNSNESENPEYESQFLNYDLGLSDEITTPKNNHFDEILFSTNKEKIINEYEKPVEEIEKVANEIYNSHYKQKKMSYIYEIKDNIDINTNTEELKEGEEIKTILSLYINKKNK